MIAVVQIASDGTVVVSLDSDDIPEDEDERKLKGLVTDDLLDQCSRVAIETFFALCDRPGDDGHGE